MFKKIILASSCLALIITAVNSPLTVNAADPIIDPTYVSSDTGNKPYEEGNYTLNDIMSIVIKASSWILGIVGSLALLMFIYGGFMFLISAGSSEKVGQAQKILMAAVIGLLIVFSSYLIIKFVLSSLGLNWNGEAKVMTPPTTNTSTATNKKTCADLGQGFKCMQQSEASTCQEAYSCGDTAIDIKCCKPGVMYPEG